MEIDERKIGFGPPFPFKIAGGIDSSIRDPLNLFLYGYDAKYDSHIIKRLSLNSVDPYTGDIALKGYPTPINQMVVDTSAHELYVSNFENTEIIKIRTGDPFEIIGREYIDTRSIPEITSTQIETFIVDPKRDSLYVGCSIQKNYNEIYTYSTMLAIFKLSKFEQIALVELPNMPDSENTEMITDLGIYGFNSYALPKSGANFMYITGSGTYPPGTGTLIKVNLNQLLRKL
eukprot:TRINITY_DN4606_c0_g1_i2.p1 TRINITY_DN4606_c0_g1~~TRINITY_DN4606_c0_g1_i2.p1  ORF type:complete len:231 (-),score=53.82 TRINITY_DN4606_c0_g1_i2:43-735(-)